MKYRREDPVETWEGMLKYVPPSFSQQLLDKQNRLTHENKLASDYIAKFDEYLNRCGAIELESPNRPYLGLGQALGMITAESSSLEASRFQSRLIRQSPIQMSLEDPTSTKTDFRDSSKSTTSSKLSYN